MATADPQATDDGQYRSAPFVRYPVSPEIDFVYFPLERTAALLPTNDVKVLASCTTFDSLAAHSARLANSGGAHPDVVAQLTRLRDTHRLIAATELFTRSPNVGDDKHPPIISWLCLPTHSRTPLLSRALTSYIAHLSTAGRKTPIFVADDSPAQSISDANFSLLRTATTLAAHTVHYAGRADKRRYVERLARSDAGLAHSLSFALLGNEGSGSTYGANRNAILLHTLGSTALMADDDTICEVSSAPTGQLPVRMHFADERDPADLWFFANRADALKARHVHSDIDILAEHEAMLGASLPDLVAEWGSRDAANVRTICAHMLMSALTGRGTVSITVNGLAGDSGMASAAYYMLRTDDATRQRLVASEMAYSNAMSSCEVIRQVTTRTVTHGGPIMGMFMGVDNRDMLPPFFPMFRNEDGGFAALIASCFSDAYCGHVPYALLHAGTDTRQYRPSHVVQTHMCDVLGACIATWSPRHLPPSRSVRLRSLGRHLLDLASLSEIDFEDVVRHQLMAVWHQSLLQLHRVLRLFNRQPAYWARDLQSRLDALSAQLVSAHVLDVVDVTHANGGAICPGLPQRLVKQYGALLRDWPDICEWSRSARQAGLTLGKQVPIASAIERTHD